MAITYRAGATGMYIFNGYVLDCPTCGADRGLLFTTTGTSYWVTGSCPNNHVWEERRLPAEAVREAAIASERRSNRG